ncbi:hypothetical protein acsn021_33800 [Anaerocolumna cellulosilytica]|uniref:Uncharacterized protein n=1 Tax=Anaerocolumna cellulosilytica TaxID=433286 RepID=A0A6S6RAC7_9FIRM|nr:hypothetical protein [Anaerocolumna cellulosilytica]MBB5196795.1 2,4-dienoyl-CoA reductase-like NADH-dependent reductase (Old Yellow Enzyme family) [Anaerocolumna cellulosilytica]BCJ95811.1 hypothetical protein acsn021_33800 [Anaerocolumna cellulosilytica]
MSFLKKSLANDKLPLKNRLVFPPMATSESNEDGKVSKGLIDYYDEL